MKFNFLNSRTLLNIATIFLVGFVVRVCINNLFEINVFKDYLNVISLGFYGFIASFSVYINSIPKINFSVLNPFVVADAIYNSLFHRDAIPIGSFFSCNNSDTIHKPVGKVYTNAMIGGNNQGNKYHTRPKPTGSIPGAGAALMGIYENKPQGYIPEKNESYNSQKISIVSRIRCRLAWHIWIKHTNTYTSYEEFKSHSSKKRG